MTKHAKTALQPKSLTTTRTKSPARQDASAGSPNCRASSSEVLSLVCRSARHLGLVIDPTATLEQWLDLGRQFNRADDLLAWMIGDWTAFGMERVRQWGHSIYDKAVEVTGYEIGTLQNLASVARSVNTSRRREELSHSHHIEISTLGDELQTYWLDQAIKHGLSSRELRASIKAGKLTRLKDLEAKQRTAEGIHTPAAIRTQFEMTYRQITERAPVDKWSPELRATWKRELQPIVDLYSRL